MRSQWPSGPRKKNIYLPYKNKFESDLHKFLTGSDYEDKKRVVKYEIKSKYNPDFTYSHLPWLLVEAKGRFMGGSKEAAKYVWVKKCHPRYEFVFIFQNPNNKAYPGCRRRKDGTFLTMGEWAIKNGFLSYHCKHLPSWLRDGTIDKLAFNSLLNSQRETYGMRPIELKPSDYLE